MTTPPTTLVKLINQCYICHTIFADAGNLRSHLVNSEGLNISKPLNKRRKNTKDTVFYKAMRGEIEPYDLKTVYACPNSTDYCDAEDHYKKYHLSDKRVNEDDRMVLAHKKLCFSILTPVKNTTLYGPKFKRNDVVRLEPFVRMAIECNKENQENQRTLRALAQYPVQMSLIRECLPLDHADEIPLFVWTHALEGHYTTNQQRFHRLVQHVTTWFL